MTSFLNKKTPLTDEEHDKIKKLLEKSPIRNNPDFVYLECAYHTHCNNYTQAKKRYEDAYNIFASNACILSNESNFLKDYIRIHKHIQ